MEASIGFPDLLDLLEEYASDLISGIELGDLEWFHRIRNNLYHEGNGITVAEEQLESYRAVAGVLYENLFGLKLVTPSPSATGAFLDHWAELENRLRTAAMKYTRKPQRMPPEALLQVLLENGVIDETFVSGFSKLRQERNVIAHGYSIGGFDAAYIIQELTTLTNALPPWRTD